jgi:two-component system alkaline phosphatase synthesis response regulator PhoP
VGQKILIIEDDQPIADLLAYVLQKEGYEVLTSYRGLDGLALLSQEPDLLLLDWSLPDISGLEICRMVTQQQKIPIIMLTAKNLLQDKLLGLEIGADDYITKPFDIREVTMRIKAVLRRIQAASILPQMPDTPLASIPEIHIGEVSINPATHTVCRNSRAVSLTPLEYDLLLYLYENRNQALSRDQIMDAVWGYDYLGSSRTVDIHIVRLRKKLNLSQQIQTVYKMGYRMMLPEE